jgi:uncharacterized protein (DUF2147 family)
MTRFLMLVGLLFVGAFNGMPAAAQTAAGGTPAGRWLTQSGNFEIDIASCGKALCGTVVRVLGNQSMSQPGVEAKSDAQAAMGMKILTDLTPSDDGEWEGQIYNRENGKTYDCIVVLSAPDQLEVRGYKWLTLFGKTQVWTRVKAGKS